MKALSIRQPWAWLVVNGWKNIENRECRFSHRGQLLIHAASWMTQADYDACRIFVDSIHDDLAMPAPADLPRGGIVGEVTVLDCVDAHPSPWFTGTWGLVLDEAMSCPIIPWRGMPGLFEVPCDPLSDGPRVSVALRRCRVCGCTDADCRQCIQRTGVPCHWVDKDLCSACAAGWNGLIRIKRGNTNVASIRVGNQTLHASATSSDTAAAIAVAAKAAKAAGAHDWRVERVHVLSIKVGRAGLFLDFNVPAGSAEVASE
jgi:hypothetical protein